MNKEEESMHSVALRAMRLAACYFNNRLSPILRIIVYSYIIALLSFNMYIVISSIIILVYKGYMLNYLLAAILSGAISGFYTFVFLREVSRIDHHH